MPELPEVETIVRKLRQFLPGQIIEKVTALHPKPFTGEPTALVGVTVVDVQRRAKIIQVILDNDHQLLIHLKMTGQLIYVDKDHRVGGGHPTADWVQALLAKHTRVSVTFASQAQLFFNDQRLFGWIKVVPASAVPAFFAELGPDIIDDSVTPAYVFNKFKNRRQPVKQVIMDNAVVCGVGNIYACDSLNLAQISPFRPAHSLTEEEVTRLLVDTKQVILKGIELGGTTFDGKYVDIDGMAGKYQSVVRVYGREGQACLHCGTPIKKQQLGGRGTYFCPNCQK